MQGENNFFLPPAAEKRPFDRLKPGKLGKSGAFIEKNRRKSEKKRKKLKNLFKKEVQETKIQQETVSAEESNGLWNSMANNGRADRWNTNIQNRQKEAQGNSRSVFMIVVLLAFTSVISMYISTLHTATYLIDYADIISAWLMSASVTAYNATAFEVSVLFHTSKRNFMATIFMFLWVLVTLFSMATTVSVFYDQFNFQETQIAEENKQVDSNKKALEVLRTKEKDLRESIDFKKKDIEYRQEHDYATTAVRTELNQLQNELQANLTQQENLLKETPEVTEEKVQRKESLFAFLGRLWKLEGGILEFIMSTLSAIFVNLIAPLSLTAVTELMKNKKQDLTK